MTELTKVIKMLSGKSVNCYKSLCGYYSRNHIGYHIERVYGVRIKYCSVNVIINTQDLFKGYDYDTQDVTPMTSYISRDFIVHAYMLNEEMRQNEANVQKGFFSIYNYGQCVLPSSCVSVDRNKIIISMDVRLPYNVPKYVEGDHNANQKGSSNNLNSKKKGIISEHALRLLLLKSMPKLVETFVEQFSIENLNEAVALYRDQQYIRAYLKQNSLISFIANGSSLPRKGKTDYKEVHHVIPFKSPRSLEKSILLPSGKTIRGMAVPTGVTVITGDAYHGKSTLLNAIQSGVHNHVKGDGREYIITDESAMSIKSEDGRSIKNADISFFLNNIPIHNINPQNFSTGNASGSTSQAAAVFEAIESGCRLMLFDEDRSANNFMYKDEEIKKLLKYCSTRPFIENVQMLYKEYGISSVIVVGGSGMYLGVANCILLVENFEVYHVRSREMDIKYDYIFKLPRRIPNLKGLREICLKDKISIIDDKTISIGNAKINVTEIVPYVTQGQMVFIASFIYYMAVMEVWHSQQTLPERVDIMYSKVNGDINKIRQWRFLPTSCIEYVRKYDILSLLYRVQEIVY